MTSSKLREQVGDLRQLASVRRIMLDEGAERGSGALLFSTGGGLDFMVLVDRALDIGTLGYWGVPLAWQSPSGFRSPALWSPYDAEGTGFNLGFSGLLMTCGLDHIRQPRSGQPLHGRLPGTPARLTNYGEDWGGGEPKLFCEGEIVQSRYGGECLRLRRRIEAPIGGCELRLVDEVENCAPQPWPQAMLYHINFGFPAIANGTTVALAGREFVGPVVMGDAAAVPEVVCVPSGSEAEAECTVSTPGEGLGLRVSIAYSAPTLPFLQLWRDLRPRAGLIAVEPCTSARNDDGTSYDEPPLEPGAKRTYSLRISVSGSADPNWLMRSVGTQGLGGGAETSPHVSAINSGSER